MYRHLNGLKGMFSLFSLFGNKLSRRDESMNLHMLDCMGRDRVGVLLKTTMTIMASELE